MEFPILRRLADSERVRLSVHPVRLHQVGRVGGKAMTWAQLEEMRDAGVDIEAHTVSHHDLRHAPRDQDYTSWLHNEVYGCKETLESKLGVKIIAFALPYGGRPMLG